MCVYVFLPHTLTVNKHRYCPGLWQSHEDFYYRVALEYLWHPGAVSIVVVVVTCICDSLMRTIEDNNKKTTHANVVFIASSRCCCPQCGKRKLRPLHIILGSKHWWYFFPQRFWSQEALRWKTRVPLLHWDWKILKIELFNMVDVV